MIKESLKYVGEVEFTRKATKARLTVNPMLPKASASPAVLECFSEPAIAIRALGLHERGILVASLLLVVRPGAPSSVLATSYLDHLWIKPL